MNSEIRKVLRPDPKSEINLSQTWVSWFPFLTSLLIVSYKQVRQVIWSQDDSKIVSCGMDGAVYEWNVANFKREGESVLKSCSYTSVSVSPDGRTTFAVGSDRTLKEICDSQVRFQLKIFDCSIQ